jgi:putative cell wall-binding protein
VIIGGEGAVSADVAEQISDAGYDVDRIEGTTRLQTAASVALVYGRDEGVVGTVDGDRTAVMASETGFADALAIGPLANALNLPLLLTPPDAARDTGVNNAVFQLELDRIIIAGGEGAVSEDVAEFYRERDIVVERLAGRDRTETAAVIADAAIDRFAFSAELALLARGDDFPDALAASAHAGTLTAPLLLTANPTVLSPSTEGWFTDRCPDVEAVRAIGGTGAVSEQALSEAVSAAEQCREDGPGFTFCSNAEADYTVSHPDDWATNIESIDDVPACSLFDPDADAIRAEGSTVPADIAVYLRASDIDFAEASTANMDEELLDRRETTVDGRDAVRLEVRFTGEGAFDEGTLGTRWVIDRGDEILIGVSYDIGEPAYAEKQEVLDAMVDSLAFDLG